MAKKERDSGMNQVAFYQQLAGHYFGSKANASEPKFVSDQGEIYSIGHNTHPELSDDIFKDSKIIGEMVHPDLMPGAPSVGADVTYYACYDEAHICLYASLKLDPSAIGKSEPHFGLLLWTSRKDTEPWGVDFTHQLFHLITNHLKENILAFEDPKNCKIEFQRDFLQVAALRVLGWRALEIDSDEAA